MVNNYCLEKNNKLDEIDYFNIYDFILEFCLDIKCRKTNILHTICCAWNQNMVQKMGDISHCAM